ncbi:MAG: lytic transglycosylase domain-containing protein [Acidobacteriia bacterium]|nr:lytic transglycosylase domain-containing protein [Terriglobia bacterium]
MTLHGQRLARVILYEMKCATGFLALIVAGSSAFGGEYVVFSSGLKLRADRHEQSGSVIRLFHNGGVMEIPVALVSGFEEEEVLAPEPITAVVAPVIRTESAAPAALDPKEMVRDAARRSGLPPEFVESVALVESGFRPGAVSPKGAMGVMQLMPGTAKTLGADPHDTAQNIDAGTRLLRELLVKYDGDVVKALAAYNAGEGAVDKYQGMPPYNETRWYVKKVIDAYQKAGGR